MAQIKETLRIGKSGITPGVIQELKDQLKARKRVRVKFLGSLVENNQEFVKLAEELAKNTNSVIEHKVGHTATYLKK